MEEVLFMILAWRLYLGGAALLLLNALSGLVFKPSKDEGKRTLKSILFIPVWPLAIFSRSGRAILLKHAENL
jgi:hypothetical protein